MPDNQNELKPSTGEHGNLLREFLPKRQYFQQTKTTPRYSRTSASFENISKIIPHGLHVTTSAIVGSQESPRSSRLENNHRGIRIPKVPQKETSLHFGFWIRAINMIPKDFRNNSMWITCGHLGENRPE